MDRATRLKFSTEPINLQAKAILVKLNRENTLEDIQFSGAYIYASWFLTGEQRPYRTSSGAFARIKPINPECAWETAIYYSYVDLDDGSIKSGKAANITPGIIWYLTEKNSLHDELYSY